MIQDAMFGSMLAVLFSRKNLMMEIRHFLKPFIVNSVDLRDLTRKFFLRILVLPIFFISVCLTVVLLLLVLF